MDMKVSSNSILFLDTAPFIYFFEENPAYFPRLLKLFDAVYDTGAQVYTSIVTYIELLTQPARLGNSRLVSKYKAYLCHSENLNIFPLDVSVADRAVSLRAKYGLKTPDAIQLGAAIECGADVVISNDKSWKRVEEIPVILVEELDA